MRLAPAFLGTVLFVTGSFGLVSAWVVHDKNTRAFVHGVRTHAEVVEKYQVNAADGTSEHLIAIQFKLPTGAAVTTKAALSPVHWDRHSKGDKVLVAYLPGEPHRAVLDSLGKPGLLLPIFVSAVAALVAALGFAIVASCLRAKREHAALYLPSDRS